MSLRERKKQATRDALIETGRRLFGEKGYENTTLEEICAEVQIHVSTFFSYFESKEELAFARMISNFEKFREMLRNRPSGSSALDCWWTFVETFWEPERGEEQAFVMSLDSVPALRSRGDAVHRMYAEEIADALAAEAGRKPGEDLFSYVLATTAVSVSANSARWYVSRFDDKVALADTVEFSKLVAAHFPERQKFEDLLASLRKKTRKQRPRSPAKNKGS